ncbi:signal peptidase II [Pedobacter xixiisoli]|uniref:Lipoprotein signal peptidase n=1 Tax=Pedobacter xixiisoli TaxID=1476464 RepID=A0A286AET3_9SPHI|nr:signal peptidase II [Pedobacter xixiisoli]SOD20413.1 signal peptidase II [Pedobacter xixiisoli]
MKKQSIKFAFLLIIVALNLGCDQFSKVIARKNIAPYEQIDIIKDRFTLTLVENTGAFLSAGSNLPNFVRIIVLTILPIIVLGYGLWFLYSNKHIPRLMQVGICFLIGGGIGNIYDRIVYGSVTDFLHMDFVLFRTGIFNMADVSIMVGIGLLLLQNLTAARIKKQEATQEEVSA